MNFLSRGSASGRGQAGTSSAVPYICPGAEGKRCTRNASGPAIPGRYRPGQMIGVPRPVPTLPSPAEAARGGPPGPPSRPAPPPPRPRRSGCGRRRARCRAARRTRRGSPGAAGAAPPGLPAVPTRHGRPWPVGSAAARSKRRPVARTRRSASARRGHGAPGRPAPACSRWRGSGRPGARPPRRCAPRRAASAAPARRRRRRRPPLPVVPLLVSLCPDPVTGEHSARTPPRSLPPGEPRACARAQRRRELVRCAQARSAPPGTPPPSALGKTWSASSAAGRGSAP